MEPDDIPDFIELAINYRDLSPRSHLEMRIMPLFTARPTSDCHESILCAEITASEALLSIAGDPSCLPFVLFDVRSPDAFNQCHLHSTMHLEESVDGDKLLAQLEHHIESLQMPPEETHVCLIGESKNDPTVISFVSQLLKKRRKYLSIINGGFEVRENKSTSIKKYRLCKCISTRQNPSLIPINGLLKKNNLRLQNQPQNFCPLFQSLQIKYLQISKAPILAPN